METLAFLLAVISFSVYAFMTQCATPSDDLDLASLRTHVLKLEETVTSLQSQTQTQEQKYSAVLSSVLSKLSDTTNELTGVKKELSDLKDDYKVLQTDLAAVKAQTLQTDESLINNVSLINDNISNLEKDMNVSEGRVMSEVIKLKSDLNMTGQLDIMNIKLVLNAAEQDLKSVQKHVENITKTISSTQTDFNLIKMDVNNVSSLLQALDGGMKGIQTDVQQLTSNISNSSEKLNILQTNITFEVNLYNGSIDVSKNDFIKFNKIRYCTSGVYNVTTGKFTTPVDGTYLFWFQAYVVSKNSHAREYIQSTNHRSIGFADGRTGQNETFAPCTGITVAFLTKGEHVWFNNTRDQVKYGGHSSYGGTLLSPALHSETTLRNTLLFT